MAPGGQTTDFGNKVSRRIGYCLLNKYLAVIETN